MDFNKIIGQKEVIDSLRSMLSNNKTGHAFIFNGPKGIGKKTVASIFAALLLCGNLENSCRTCGTCMPCSLLANGTNPDFHVVKPSNGSIGVEEIRKIQGDVVVKPYYSPKKVYLITDADKMTVQAQNCLLKTLEEPPEYVVILLTTANYEALLETIRSRAVKLNFKKNSSEEVRGFLKVNFGHNDKSMDFIVAYSDGIIGTAEELAGSDELNALREKIIELVFRLKNSKLHEIFEIYSFFEANKNSLDTIFDVMMTLYRDLLVVKQAGKEIILINSDKKDIILRNVSDFSVQKLIDNMETLEDTRGKIKHNANYQLSIEVMLMKLQEANV